MLIHFEGEDYQFDIEEMDVTQARYLKRTLNMTFDDLQAGLQKLDPDAMVGLYWLMLNQNGKVVDANKVNFKLIRLLEAFGDAADREQENPATGETPEATPNDQT